MIKKGLFIQLVGLLSANVVYEFVKDTGIDYTTAFNTFYSSDTYRKLEDRRTRYWRESAQYIYESLYRELHGLPIND